MKLEVEYPLRHSRSFYGATKWLIDDDMLVQVIPSDAVKGTPSFSLVPGDNIRIDGEKYYVESHQLSWKEDRKTKGREYSMIYRIKKGRYVPPRWVEIGEISQ